MIKIYCANSYDTRVVESLVREMYSSEKYRCGWSKCCNVFNLHPTNVGYVDEIIDMFKLEGRIIYKTVEVKVYG